DPGRHRGGGPAAGVCGGRGHGERGALGVRPGAAARGRPAHDRGPGAVQGEGAGAEPGGPAWQWGGGRGGVGIARRERGHVTGFGSSARRPDEGGNPGGGIAGDFPDPWGVRRAENLLTTLDGVLSARVV